MIENAVRNAQPAHIGFLRRRAVEQTEEAPAKIVVGFRRFVIRSLLLQPFVSIERIKVTFELFRIGKFTAGFDNAILRAQRGGIWPSCLHGRRARLRCIGVCGARGPRDL
jgi:hypothetical protein